MKIYVPVYDFGHKVAEIETNNAKYMRFDEPRIMYYGSTYNGANLFTTPEGVAAYWARDYEGQRNNSIAWNDVRIKWKEIY